MIEEAPKAEQAAEVLKGKPMINSLYLRYLDEQKRYPISYVETLEQSAEQSAEHADEEEYVNNEQFDEEAEIRRRIGICGNLKTTQSCGRNAGNGSGNGSSGRRIQENGGRGR